MKKKLLTILLSIFVIISAFTTRVFAASYQYVSDISAIVTNMPSFSEPPIPAGAWTNGNDGYLVKIGDGFAIVNAAMDAALPISSSDIVSDNGDGTYSHVDYGNKVLFTITNDTLINVIVRDFTDEYATLNGTYTAPSGFTTVADIIPDNFADDESNFLWLNENYSNVIFHESGDVLSLYFVGDLINGFSNKEVSENTNGNYETNMITDQGESLSFEFIMNEDKFDSFIINGFTGDSAVANGTYKPAIGLSSLMTNSFPLESDNEHYWTSEDKELYLVEDDGFKYLHFNKGDLFVESSNYHSSNISVKKLSDSKYQCKDLIYTTTQTTEVMTLTFNVKGTFLESIDAEFTGDFSQLNGTYVAPVTITDILNTVNNFPSTSTDDAPLNAWVNKNGNKAYINKNNELILEGAPAAFAVNTLLTKTGDNYTVTLSGITLTFIMEAGELKEIERNYMSTISTFAPYEFVNDKREITVGSTGEVSFTTNANYYNDPTKVTVQVQLEGEASPTTLTYDTDYTLETGSTIVKLKGDYVKTLPLGTHTITIEVDGYSPVSQQFKIKSASSSNKSKKYNAPNTGVTGNNHSLLKISSLSLLAIGTYIVIKKKKDN